MSSLNSTTHDQWEEECPSATPRWWLLLWFCWGSLVSLIVFYFDRNCINSATWLLVSFAIVFSYRLLRPIVIALVEYYADRDDPDAQRRVELTIDGDVESDEYKSLMKRLNDDCIPIAMFVGVFHGLLAGGIGGALANYDGYFANTSSLLMACYGALVGMFFLPLWYGMLLAFLLPRDGSESYMQTLRRRFALAYSTVYALAHVANRLHQRCDQ